MPLGIWWKKQNKKSLQIIPTKHSCDIYQYSYVCIEFIMSLTVNKRKKVRKPGSLFFCSDNFKVINKRRGNTNAKKMEKCLVIYLWSFIHCTKIKTKKISTCYSLYTLEEYFYASLIVTWSKLLCTYQFIKINSTDS